MIYAVCPRPLWNLPATTARFGATTLGLGCAGTNALFAMLPWPLIGSPRELPARCRSVCLLVEHCWLGGWSTISCWRTLRECARVEIACPKAADRAIGAGRDRAGRVVSGRLLHACVGVPVGGERFNVSRNGPRGCWFGDADRWRTVRALDVLRGVDHAAYAGGGDRMTTPHPAPTSSTTTTTWLRTALNILHQHDGPLTRELLLSRPVRSGTRSDARRPDATTRVTCGFCSTGCSLDIHLRDGEAVGLSPSTGYPVNLGMACPKGWEALRYSAPTTVRPSLCGAPTAAWSPLRGRRRSARSSSEFVSCRRNMDRKRWRFSARPNARRGAGVLRDAVPVRFGDVARRRQHPAMHGDGGSRLQAVVRVRRPSAVVHRLGRVRLFDLRWRQSVHRPPHPVGTGDAQHPVAEIVVVDPGPPKRPCRPLGTCPSPEERPPLLYGVARELIVRDWLDHRFIDEHTNGFDEFRQVVAPFTSDRVASETGLPTTRSRGWPR